MGQQLSRPGSWLDAIKLALLSTAVGVVQLVRYQLAIAERAEREAEERLHHRGHGRRRHDDDRGKRGGGLLASVPADVRRACMNLIDYQLTPVLVDQWRVTLVQLLFESASAAPLPETDPELRAALLDSLKSYEEQERQRPAFTQRPQVPVPEAAGHHQQAASAPGPSAAPPQPSAAAQAAAAAARRVTQPAEPNPARRTAAAAAAAAEQAGPSSSAAYSIPGKAPARPSAPPLSEAMPTQQPPQPSAPPLPDDAFLHEHAEGSSEGSGVLVGEEDLPDTECHICMDAQVEVQSDSCPHRMCIPCAKAVCSLPERAPQCPFCRRAITGFVPISAVQP